MSTTDFKQSIELFPKNSSDLNVILEISYSEYKTYISTLDVLLLGNKFFKPLITAAVSSLDAATYSTIIKSVGILISTLKSVSPGNITSIDLKIGEVGNLLSIACTDYLGSIPGDLYNIFNDIKNQINNNATISLGPGLSNILANSLLKLKEKALNEMLGSDIFNTIISPLIMYEKFLKDNDINDIITLMIKLENCMTKPGIGNRPRKDFVEPTTNKLYSTYYKELFLIDSNGKLNIKSLGVNDSKNIAQLNNVMSVVNTFRLTVSF